MALHVLLVVLLAQVGQGAERPNFSGRWLLVAPAVVASQGRQEQIVSQDGPVISVRSPQGTIPPLVYRLDGRPTSISYAGREATLSAEWKGDQLVLRSAATALDGQVLENLQYWTLTKAGRLLIEPGPPARPGSMTLEFERQPD
jgi:hypothetical protein